MPRQYENYSLQLLDRKATERWNDKPKLEGILDEIDERLDEIDERVNKMPIIAFQKRLDERIESLLKQNKSQKEEKIQTELKQIEQKLITDAQTSGHGPFNQYSEIGPLGYFGYTVGKTHDIPREKRRLILDYFFNQYLNNFVLDRSECYIAWWLGDRQTSTRLKEMAKAIVRSIQRCKGSNNLKAIKKYEEDLAYLKKEYYIGKFDFKWTETDVKKNNFTYM